MAKKQAKTRQVELYITSSSFASIFRRLRGEKSDYNFEAISELRQLISNEKARVLYIIKNQNPDSIYSLAKLLKRDFKSVRQDVKLLEKFGFLTLKPETTGNRKKLKPIIAIDKLQISLNF